MKFFNTAGPVNCKNHYCLNPLDRINLQEILYLINQMKYFILHAPRQTGKTSCLLALMEYLNNQGNFICLYVNVEIAQAARENVKEGMRAIIDELSSNAFYNLADSFLKNNCKKVLEESGEFNALQSILNMWCSQSLKPIVLFIDEADSLVGDTLISLLRQLRAGYPKRPNLFPQSIVLCGVRDIQDYRIHSDREKGIITGGSAFNIKAESIRIGDFTKEETEKLYMCHTQETGQEFTTDAIEKVWDLTCGQPWLVNALGYEVCFKMKEDRNRTKLITQDLILQAKENIIMRRETHLDQLTDKLQEERVKRVIAPILSGEILATSFHKDDVGYVEDLGLIKREPDGQLHIANSIYKEVIPRELVYDIQSGMSNKPSWYIKDDETIDINKLIMSFQEFFREHSEHWIERFQYKEAGPQLLMQAFLQRIVNGGGIVNREYGLGMMRTDLFVIWPYGKNKENKQKIVIELKVLYKSLKKTIEDGLKQTAKYMDKCATSEGHLVIFDRTKKKSWDKKIFRKEEDADNKKIIVWGM